MSIFENAVLVRESAHVYKQVCGANLRLNGRRYFSIPFKLGQSGSAASPLPRVRPFFYFIIRLFSVYTFFIRNPWFALSRRTVFVICLRTKCPHYHTAYAAVEPCRRQRPERSEDAAREQAAEGRMAKRFRHEIKKANESIRHATLQRKKNILYLYRAG